MKQSGSEQLVDSVRLFLMRERGDLLPARTFERRGGERPLGDEQLGVFRCH